MGEGSRSPQFYPCHHLSQRAGQVHGGREQVTTIVPLSPFSTEVWASSWGREVGHHIFYLVTIWHRGLGQLMGKGEQVTTILPLSPFNTQVWSSSWGKGVAHQNFTLVTIQHRGLGKFMGEGVGHQHFTLATIWQRGIGQFMGEGRRSPHFYPCHHLAQWAGPVHGGREQVTTIVPLSPFSTQVWVTSWGKEVGHHNFTLVTIQHTGLGQFMGEGSRSPHFLPGNHLAQRAGPVYGGKEQATTIVPLSPFSTQVWASSWGKGVGHQNFTLLTNQHRGLGKFMGEGSRSPHFYPCHRLAQGAGSVHGERE